MLCVITETNGLSTRVTFRLNFKTRHNKMECYNLYFFTKYYNANL